MLGWYYTSKHIITNLFKEVRLQRHYRWLLTCKLKALHPTPRDNELSSHLLELLWLQNFQIFSKHQKPLNCSLPFFRQVIYILEKIIPTHVFLTKCMPIKFHYLLKCCKTRFQRMNLNLTLDFKIYIFLHLKVQYDDHS